MAFDAYIKIDGIPGEALDSKHKDWIEIKSYNFGVSQEISETASSAGGATAGRSHFSDFHVSKVVDKASAKLFETCAKGTHIPKIIIHVNRAGGDQVKYLEITLEQVLISSFTHSANTEGDLPVENFTLNYAKIKTAYTQQKRTDGQGGGQIAGGWDRTANKTYA